MLSTISKEDLDKINELLKILFKANLIIGGLVMMSYYYLIGFFPYDLSIGDGLLFIGVAIAFGFIDLLFTTLFSCVGFKLRGVILVITKAYLKFSKRNQSRDEIMSMVPNETGITIWIPALLGWLVMIKLSLHGNLLETFTALVILIFTSWFCSHCISSYLQIKEEESLSSEPINKNRRQLKTLYLLVLLLFPVFIEGVMSTMSTGTMRLMKIRQDNVTVHISNPYAQFAIEGGTKGEVSAMGSDYLKFENVDILYTGPGKNTVLQFTNRDKKNTKLIIPTEKIFIPR